jgi:two-component system, response regulator FlrC
MGTVLPPQDFGHQQVPVDDQVAEKLVGHTVAEVERALIIRTLCVAEWNRTRAATTLGISLRCLRNKIHQFKEQGIAIPAASRSRAEFADATSCRWMPSGS